MTRTAIEITKTKHGEYRVWHTATESQVGIYPTMAKAKTAAKAWAQVCKTAKAMQDNVEPD